VNVYRNPCRDNAKSIYFKGHSEHVVRGRFSKDDKKIYSVGGYDQTILQWKMI